MHPYRAEREHARGQQQRPSNNHTPTSRPLPPAPTDSSGRPPRLQTRPYNSLDVSGSTADRPGSANSVLSLQSLAPDGSPITRGPYAPSQQHSYLPNNPDGQQSWAMTKLWAPFRSFTYADQDPGMEHHRASPVDESKNSSRATSQASSRRESFGAEVRYSDTARLSAPRPPYGYDYNRRALEHP